ncbi:MAG: hypothetical protein C4323_17620 [Mastigocladus sp. ERB_26_2]
MGYGFAVKLLLNPYFQDRTPGGITQQGHETSAPYPRLGPQVPQSPLPIFKTGDRRHKLKKNLYFTTLYPS